MGWWKILKTNLGAIRTQRDFEVALEDEDTEKSKRLIAESISKILKAGLTKKKLDIIEDIRSTNGEQLNKLISAAFQRGWIRSGEPNLSNAMDEVLLEAQNLIREYRSHGLDKFENR